MLICNPGVVVVDVGGCLAIEGAVLVLVVEVMASGYLSMHRIGVYFVVLFYTDRPRTIIHHGGVRSFCSFCYSCSAWCGLPIPAATAPDIRIIDKLTGQM